LVFTGGQEVVEPAGVSIEGRRRLVLGVPVLRDMAYRRDCMGRKRRPRGSSPTVARGGGAVDFGWQRWTAAATSRAHQCGASSDEAMQMWGLRVWKMVGRVTTLFIGAEAEEGRQSHEEMTGDGGAFNGLCFVKRSGGGGVI
jgi:hypothetical protein